MESIHTKNYRLAELLATLAIVVIIASTATYVMVGLINAHHLTSQSKLLLGQLQLARSEAIRRGKVVIIKSISNEDSNWTQGWIIFVDDNFDGEYDSQIDLMLHKQPPISDGMTLTSGPSYQKWLAYLPSGLPTSSININGNDSFLLCAENRRSFRTISITISGRAVVNTSSLAC